MIEAIVTEAIVYVYVSIQKIEKIEKMMHWCETNTTEYWYDDIYYIIDGRRIDNSIGIPKEDLFIRFGFTDNETAVMFKLVWGIE